MAMDRLFALMKETGASDLFLAANSPIQLKIRGELMPVNQQKIDPSIVRKLLNEIVPASQIKDLDNENELNISVPVRGVGSFRLSAFSQRGTISAVIRYIPFDIPPFETLGLPPILAELVERKHGLLLMVGSTGSGKSTTIASILDYRNQHKNGHILTLEDPIEFLFRNNKSIVNQREVGSDTVSMQLGLKNALRQAPDCIFIGEIRDKETMAAALAYAQSGHLVVSTLHANNTYRALNRIISFFPLENRQALLEDLSACLLAIASQRLVNTIEGPRRPAVEIMLNTHHISELIEEGKISQIKDAMEKSLAPGSQTFEQSLMGLINEGVIDGSEALRHADSASNLYWLIHNHTDGTKAPPRPGAEQAPAPQPPNTTFNDFSLNI